MFNDKPDQVIADGRNYTSFVQAWKRSAEKQNADLYVTVDDGYWDLAVSG